MTYHTRPAIRSEAEFGTFVKDVVWEGKAFMRYDERDICLNYFIPPYADFDTKALVIEDVSGALRSGKFCDTYRLEVNGVEARGTLHSYMAEVGYNMMAFFEWCDSLGVNHDSGSCRYIDKKRKITIFKGRTKGVGTFSPLALSHLNPLKEIPKKWTMSHVKRLLAAGQYSYCGVEQRYTSDYSHDLKSNFGKSSCSGESFLKHLTEQPSGWEVLESDGRVNDGEELYVRCCSFEVRVIKIDLGASRTSRDISEDV